MALLCSHPECFDYRECMHRSIPKKPPAPSIRKKRGIGTYRDHIGRRNYNCNHGGTGDHCKTRYATQCMSCAHYMRADSPCLPNYPVPCTTETAFYAQYVQWIADSYWWERWTYA